MNIAKIVPVLVSLLALPLLVACGKEEASQTAGDASDKATETVSVQLSEKDIDNIIRRSYPYVAMYNVINKNAMMESPFMTGWNGTVAMEGLADHTLKMIARPNNDTLYVSSTLDLRNEPVIVSYPAFDSKFVNLETSAYDHYCGVPLSTTKGDFEKPTKILFYSARTPSYTGAAVDGVDEIIEMSGDFATAFLRVMPHAAEPERMQKNLSAMQEVKVQTLSEYQGESAKVGDEAVFPAYSSDSGVFENNFLEVMQFVFNHTTFDPKDPMDQAVLAAFKPLGVEPGKNYDPEGVASLDGNKLADAGRKIHQEALDIWASPENPHVNDLFKPKGEMAPEPMVLQSAYGPIGLPADQAVYPGISTADGEPMNAQNDYVIRMSKDDMPPATVFWSVTLYDSENGFFIPNDRKKYSVGENAGFQLDEDGGIEIYIAARQPEGVPEENWLPINRKNEDLDVVMRIYAPDQEKMKTWKAPKAEALGSTKGKTAGAPKKESATATTQELTPDDARVIAKEAYIFGFPMVMNYKIIYNYVVDKKNPEYKGPFNEVSCEARLFTPDDKAIVTPNADTPYCMFWMDLRAEPLVLTVPEMEPERFYHFQLIDLYTHNYAYVGTLTTGNEAGKYLLVGSDWDRKKPNGITGVIRSETDFIFAVTRTQLFGSDDLPKVKDVQGSYNLQPLSTFLGVEAPPTEEMPAIQEWIEGSQFDERFFGYLDFMMSLLKKPGAGEKPLWGRIARLGIGSGNTFDFAALSPETQEALKAGAKDGFGEIEVFIEKYSSDPLASGKLFGTREFLAESAKKNYGLQTPDMLRSVAAHMGLYGNSAEEAIYPTYLVDADQQPLDASANRYTMTFEKGQFPPVKAFWSLTMYDGKTQLFIENPLDRYLLNSPMMDQFKKGDDGSLTLYIQKDSPGGDNESNWLPAPDGPFYVVLRLYGPKDDALEGIWTSPVVEKMK